MNRTTPPLHHPVIHSTAPTSDPAAMSVQRELKKHARLRRNLGVTAICRMMSRKTVCEEDIQLATCFATEVLRRFSADEQEMKLMQSGLTSGLLQKPFVSSYINGELQKM